LIYPTRGAIVAAGAGAPVALLIAVLLPDRWYAGLAWPAAVLILCLVDALTGPRVGKAAIRIDLPRTASVGGDIDARVTVAIAGSPPPATCEIALAAGPLVEVVDDGRAALSLEAGQGSLTVPLLAIRRGTAQVDRLWLRWRGTLGLVWKQREIACDAQTAILPDIRPVHERGVQIFERQALQGLIAQLDRGDGADFDALVEFRSGMDRRAIDWKQSARHLKLRAKEFRSERNSQLIFAVDSGRLMSEPVAGLPRIDRAVSAMLLAAWIALKLGDRVGIHAFDSQPRLSSGLVSGSAAFAELQRLAATIDYSGEETNHSFALTRLATLLHRRSMIVLLTEITDPTSADFMIRAVQRLVEKHLLLVVVLRDEELEAIVEQAPDTADDVTRAVTAQALLRERAIVLGRLRHLGVHVVDSPHDQVADRLAAAYVDLKRRDLL
jgi:uncharacterized protein (DUF58 family)